VKEGKQIRITINPELYLRLEVLALEASAEDENCTIEQYAAELVEVGIVERLRREEKSNDY
jgi:hypothetical protein